VIGPRFPDEIATQVPERTLRQFGGLCIVVFGGMFVAGWIRHEGRPGASGWIALVLAILVGIPGVIRPKSIRGLYAIAMALTKPIGHVVGAVFLAVVYFGALTPLALVFRLIGRDGLGRFRRQAESYWAAHAPTDDVRLYLRQYQRPFPGDEKRLSPAAKPTLERVRVSELTHADSPALSGANHGTV
jgi:Saxitoxin biosynthesis operon protein SxtJ